MLILTRKLGESITIGDDIRVSVLGIRGRQVRLGIDAPSSIIVHREEIYVKIQEIRKVLTDFGLPEAFREIALGNLEDLEKTFCTAGYTPPENAGPIFLF